MRLSAALAGLVGTLAALAALRLVLPSLLRLLARLVVVLASHRLSLPLSGCAPPFDTERPPGRRHPKI